MQIAQSTVPAPPRLVADTGGLPSPAIVVAACLLAFLILGLATSGNAMAASEWLIEGQTLAELKGKESVTISGGVVSLSIPSIESTIECKTSSGSGTIVKAGSDELTLSLTGCSNPKSKTCKVTEPISLKAKSEPLAAGDTTYVKLQPLSEGTFATIAVKECGSVKEGQLKGAVAAEASFELLKAQPFSTSESLTKSVNKKLAAQKSSELSLTYGGITAYLTAALSVKLSGEHTGANWQRALPTKLCAEPPAANTTTCPPGQPWPGGTSLWAEKLAGSEMTFELGFTSTTCATAGLEGTTNAVEGAPLIGTLTNVEFGGCTNNCAISRLGSNVLLLETYGTSGGSGWLQIPSLKLEFVCGATICKYRVPIVDFYFGGSEVTLLLSGPRNMLWESGATCAAPGIWKGDEAIYFEGFGYQVLSPIPTFLTN